MLKLLRAGIARLFKNNIFRLGIFVSAAAGFIAPVMGHELSGLLYKIGLIYIGMEQYSLDYWFFTYLVAVAFMGVLFSAFFTGTEYSDGTLRNKIAAGHSRTDVYLSNFITIAVGGCLLYAAYLALGLIGGLTMTDGFEVFTRSQIILYIVCAFACMVAFAAIYTLIGLLIPNKAASVVICICALLLLLLAGLMLTGSLDNPQYLDYEWIYYGVTYPVGSENPLYVGGFRREFYKFLVNFLPGGIVMTYYNLYINPFINGLYMIVGCAFFSVVPTIVGVKLFQKRELK